MKGTDRGTIKLACPIWRRWQDSARCQHASPTRDQPHDGNCHLHHIYTHTAVKQSVEKLRSPEPKRGSSKQNLLRNLELPDGC